MSEQVNAGPQGPSVETRQTLVYCPNGVEITEKHPEFSPRISTFDGKRVGLLWNSKPNGNFYLNRVAELLEKRYKDIRIIKFWEVDPARTKHADRKTDEALDFMAKSADIVIASQGD